MMMKQQNTTADFVEGFINVSLNLLTIIIEYCSMDFAYSTVLINFQHWIFCLQKVTCSTSFLWSFKTFYEFLAIFGDIQQVLWHFVSRANTYGVVEVVPKPKAWNNNLKSLVMTPRVFVKILWFPMFFTSI